jgi:hypothetical protein
MVSLIFTAVLVRNLRARQGDEAKRLKTIDNHGNPRSRRRSFVAQGTQYLCTLWCEYRHAGFSGKMAEQDRVHAVHAGFHYLLFMLY